MHAYKTYSDQELINKLRQGTDEAGEEIYYRYHPRVLNLCSQYLRSQDDGQDAAQEVFYKIIVLKKIFDFRGESSFWTWLRKIVINVCKELIRKMKRIREVCLRHQEGLKPLEEVIPSSDFTPEERYFQQEKNQRLHQAVQQLPSRYSAALTVAYFNEMSYEEAARKLKITTQGLGVRLLRGRRMLMAVLVRKFRLDVPDSSFMMSGNKEWSYGTV
ncbi:RNA polymerase sigma factor [candidate division FCPU426 bacterium]|nr:RNA polymerase sigma factor [candidate division FCPU426 bacterium]